MNGWSTCCMIWSAKGVWFQRRDRMGQLHLSDLGFLSLHSVQEFCRSKGVTLYIQGRVPLAEPQAVPVPFAVK